MTILREINKQMFLKLQLRVTFQRSQIRLKAQVCKSMQHLTCFSIGRSPVTRLDSALTLLSEDGSSKLVELSEFVKNSSSLLYLLLICVTACAVDDLTLVFGFLSGIAECLITFILPSIFYYYAINRTHRYHKKQRFRCRDRLAVAFFFTCGTVYFCLSNYYNVVKIQRAF
jgi:hypothetical protein